MAIRIYSKEKCPACGAAFSSNNGLRCPNHRNVRPVSCFIQVTGVRGYPSRRVRIYSDKEGNPLFVKTVYAVADRIRMEIQRGVFDPRQYLPQHRNHLLWKNYAKYYLDELQKRREQPKGSAGWITKSAYREYETYQRLYLIPFFGNIAISDLRLADIKKCIRELRSVSAGEVASDTIKAKALDGIRHMLRFAVSEEDIPPLSFTIPAIKRTRQKPLESLTWDQQELIMGALPKEHRLIFEFLRRSGRRENEARALTIRDVSFSKGVYYVRNAFDEEELKEFPKVAETGGAAIPMDHEDVYLVDIFRKAIGGRTGLDDFVFINPNTGRGYKAVTLNSIFRDAREKAGFLTITANEFGRHSFATRKIEEGWSFDHVSVFLLNSPEVVRKRYANVTRATRSAILQLHAKNSKTGSGGKPGAK